MNLVRRNKNNLISLITKPITLIIAGFIILAIIASAFFFLGDAVPSGSTQGVNIEKSYQVTARTKSGKLTDGEFKISITNAHYSDSLLVQGKTARPVKGKRFLVVEMEIENPYRVPLYAFPVDIFRFIREDGTKFAPSVHQGAVEIRPQATKKSNVAFVIEPRDKEFKIEVGDLNKDKEVLEIRF